MDSIKAVIRSSVKIPEFDKHLKKAGGHIGRNVVEITIKMKTIVQKNLNDKNQQASSQKFCRYGPDTKYQWKQLEKLNQKLARMTNHLTFLCRCRDLKLVPPGLTIKIPVHSRRARKMTKRLELEKNINDR